MTALAIQDLVPAALLKGLAEDARMEFVESYLRAQQRETDLRETVERAAADLLRLSAELGWGSGEPYYDAGRWLREAAVRAGLLPEHQPQAKPSGPPARHLRLHRIADTHDGWACHYCSIGLIDTCSDDDTVRDARGKRLIAPDLSKVMPTVEHLVPRGLDGSNEIENLRLACRPCNSAKGGQ